MAKKDNLKCIRLSDEMVEVIEAQQGQNFSQKFENLVTRCMWELPKKEQELTKLDQQIAKKRKELYSLNSRVSLYKDRVDGIGQLLDLLTNKFSDVY